MLKYHLSEGPAELQRGTILIHETPGIRQSYSCIAFRRHRLSVICKTHNMSTVRLYLWLNREIYLSFCGRRVLRSNPYMRDAQRLAMSP
jgi:hypothetical protein